MTKTPEQEAREIAESGIAPHPKKLSDDEYYSLSNSEMLDRHIQKIRHLAAYQAALTALNKRDGEIQRLFDAIKHGDEGHQCWLKAAIEAHFSGGEMLSYVPSKKDKENQQLQAKVEELDRHIEELRDKVSGDSCACSYDNAGDVCGKHSPVVKKLQARVEKIKQLMASENVEFYYSDHHGYVIEQVENGEMVWADDLEALLDKQALKGECNE